MRFPKELKDFTENATWTFAKTMPEWPHEYIVRSRVDENLFLELVTFIRKHGYEAPFYNKNYIYFEENGLAYWTMGAPIEETIIINRCEVKDTYIQRLKNGNLP